MKRELNLTFEYPVKPEIVWDMLTDSRKLATWLMENDHVPVVGHKFQFRSKPQPGWNGIVDCEVLEVDEPRRLVWSWKGGNGKKQAHAMVVTWTLEPVAGGTRLLLEHSGFEGARGMLLSFMMKSGWKKKLRSKGFADMLGR